jgi:predicted Zn-dependent protease
MRNNRYAYTYGLRSELLRTRPLRELAIDVRVSSELPLRSVACSTHDVRSEQTAHAGHVQFAAQEYTPTRDFEVVCEIDGRQSDVVVIPHQRGSDGYFLAQITPPAAEGQWRREVIGDGRPLELLVVCDTSGSIDGDARRQQREFVTALVDSLGKNDQFNLAVCDVDCRWALDEPAAATAANVAAALQHLDQHRSLGWTDLDQMLAQLLPRCSEQTQVVYVGDGVPSAHDADSQAFISRLRRASDGKNVGTFHAVGVSNLYDDAVLKALAGVGGGSVRHLGGELTPPQAALELLREITEPGLRDMQLQFRDVQVAAVYPGRLPNLPAGAQQIVVGRYLPQAKEQVGELIVTGRRGEDRIRYATRVRFPADANQKASNSTAEAEGNSFIPRLWARAHLDHLLAQGASQAIQDEIIAMSEEFHIITPYTSLLVLETDEDRERFGVKRRFQMRDGERFFADGRDDANYELMMQQMRLAADWRTGLRQQILAGLSGLGRDAQVLNAISNVGLAAEEYPRSAGQPRSRGMSIDFDFNIGDRSISSRSGLGGGGFGGNGVIPFWSTRDSELGEPWYASDKSLLSSGVTLPSFGTISQSTTISVPDGGTILLGGVKPLALDNRKDFSGGEFASLRGRQLGLQASLTGQKFYAGVEMQFGRTAAEESARYLYDSNDRLNANSFGLSGLMFDESKSRRKGEMFFERRFAYPVNPYAGWINVLLPPLPSPVVRSTPPKATEWPADAAAISKGLLRRDALRQLDGGIEIRRTTESRDPRWDRLIGKSEQLELFSPQAWLTRPLGADAHTVVNWCDADDRGALSLAFQLGRVRPSTDRDRREPPLALADESLRPLHEAYASYQASVVQVGDDRVELTLTSPNSIGNETRLLIDLQRRVLLERQQFVGGNVANTTTFENFVEVGGSWWAQRVTTTNAAGETTSVTTQTVAALSPAEFQQRMATELAPRASSHLVRLPMPGLQQAKQAVAAGAASIDERLVVLLDHLSRQQWEEVFQQLDAMEAQSQAKPPVNSPDQAWSGLRWIRLALEQVARRHEPALEQLQTEAERLTSTEVQDALFLANHLLSTAAGIADANEQLALVDSLRPVFAAQPAAVGALPQWMGRRVEVLRNLGRREELLALHRELAELVPWDASRQIAYANDLAAAGDHAAAYAWLQQEIDRNPRREPVEIDQLVFVYADMLFQQGRYADQVEFLQGRVEQDPEQRYIYDRYLSAIILNDDVERAEALVEAWLAESDDDQRMEGARLARVEAAVDYARGQRYNLNVRRTEDRWLAPLGEIVLRFATAEHHSDLAYRILGDGRFSDSDEADAVRAKLFERLAEQAGELDSALLASLVNTLISSPPATTDDAWQAIAATLRARWKAADEPRDRHSLGQALATIYGNRFAESEYLPFLREQMAAARQDYRAAYVRQLFDALIARPWSEANEIEAFALLPQLSEADEPVDRLDAQLPALYRLVDRMVQARVESARMELQTSGHPEKLTRTEFAAKEAEFLKAARQGVAARLAESAPVAGELLAQWYALERWTLLVQLDEQMAEAAAACWEIVGDAPPASAADAEELPAPQVDEDPMAAARTLRFAAAEAVYKQRALAMLMYLAARRDAAPELVERLLAYLDAGIARGGEGADVWRSARFQLLIALDRPDELDRSLREWIAATGPVSSWRAPLARLLAERGQLPEAIAVYEAMRSADGLSPDDQAVLANLYLAVDRRADYERAKVAAFEAIEEWQLSQSINYGLNYWRRTDVTLPTELDENVLFTFQALFRKSGSPGNYIYLLRDFYQACRDFRLLRMIPDSVLGRTQQQVYSFLNSLDGNLLSQLRDEAAGDEILARAAELRAAAKSPLDRRALDLLAALVERRAAEVQNEPGPHVEAAIAALDRAFRREWADGERIQMAKLLATLGRIAAPKLAEKQFEQLQALYDESPANSLERLQIAAWLAHAMFYAADRQDDAIELLEAEVRQFELAQAGAWPSTAIEPLETYLSLLEQRNRYAEAETTVTRLTENVQAPDMANWLATRLERVYIAALAGDGQVSLGSGEELYGNLVDRIAEKLSTPDNELRYQFCQRMLELFSTAHAKENIPKAAVQADLREFAFETLPGVLRRQTNNYESLVNQVAEKVKEFNGPAEGVEFLVTRMEHYPPRLEMGYQNAWNQHGWQLARWRHEAAGELKGELAARLLKLTLAELRRDLRERDSRRREIYSRGQYFWEQQQNAFARTASDVLAERRGSGRAVKYIADYMWSGLSLRSQAISALLRAHRDGILDDAGQRTLVQYLHHEGRYGESIALLEPLVERLPNDIWYRTMLMVAYFRTQQPEQLQQLLTETDAHFHEQGRWTEQAMAALASACRETQLYEQAVGYYDQAIALHQRQQPNRGVGGATLPMYFRQLAEVYSALGRTQQAVDAASSAIVSWPSQSNERAEALNSLRAVLRSAQDLDEFVASLDKQAAETDSDSPIIRQMLGEVYLEKGEHAAAEQQLRLAIELQPTNIATRELLIKCLDAQQKPAEAVDALLTLLDLDRRNLERLVQLAERLKDNEVEAERAATSIVEAAPQEAENHAALAEWRQKQNRWAEAIPQWEHVARLRSLEPTGLLKLAEAQVHEQRWDAAEKTVRKLQKKDWPSRFNNVRWQTEQLQRQIAEGRE